MNHFADPTPVQIVIDPNQSGGVGGSRRTVTAGDVIGAYPLSDHADCTWELRPGAGPHVGEFEVQTDRLEAWMSRVAGQWVALEFDGRIFRRLRVLHAVPLSPTTSILRVADRRFDWRYPKTWRRANLRRKGDRVITRGADVLGNEQRFLSWSVNARAGRALTAKELAIDLLANVVANAERDVSEVPDLYRAAATAAGFNVEAADGLRDVGKVIDNFETFGDTPSDILDRLLAEAELQVTVDGDGGVSMYDPTVKVPLPAAAPTDGALRIPVMRRIRPNAVDVYFIKEKQVRLKFEKNSTDLRTLRNVLQLPRDTTIENRVVPRSTWVGIDEYLKATGITDEDARRNVTNGGKKLIEKRAYDPASGEPNPVEVAKIQAVMAHYRQRFQINPRYLETLVSWSPTTVTVIDETTGARIPSPVYTRWFDMFTAFGRWTEPRLSQKVGQNYSSFPGEPSALSDQLEEAPFVVGVVDVDLGIFGIASKAILDALVTERIPSALEQIVDSGSTLVTDPAIMADAVLEENHRLEVSLTVIEALPNGRGAHHVERVNDAGGADGLVRLVEIAYTAETAKYGEDGRIANGAIVRAIAEAEAKSLLESYADAPTGVLTIAHDPSMNLGVRWHARSLRFTRDTSGGSQVVLDFGEPPPVRSAMNFLPQRVKNLLQQAARVDAPTSDRRP